MPRFPSILVQVRVLAPVRVMSVSSTSQFRFVHTRALELAAASFMENPSEPAALTNSGSSEPASVIGVAVLEHPLATPPPELLNQDPAIVAAAAAAAVEYAHAGDELVASASALKKPPVAPVIGSVSAQAHAATVVPRGPSRLPVEHIFVLQHGINGRAADLEGMLPWNPLRGLRSPQRTSCSSLESRPFEPLPSSYVDVEAFLWLDRAVCSDINLLQWRSDANAGPKSHDGIDSLGMRLASEVGLLMIWVQLNSAQVAHLINTICVENGVRPKLSFVSHSLGGLISR
jgi:hypothetical protein